MVCVGATPRGRGGARLPTATRGHSYLMNPWDVATLLKFWLSTPPGQDRIVFALLSSVTWTVVQPDYRVDYRLYPINKVCVCVYVQARGRGGAWTTI